MSQQSIHKFFLSIVIPSLLAAGLFIISFFVIIIPIFEKAMMDRKKEMILELTNTAWSVLEEYHELVLEGNISKDEAQKNAAFQIEKMRYGSEQKDYFWLINRKPEMIMHPYQKELIGKDLSAYTDMHEKRLFVDAKNTVEAKGSGFIEYYWQWKDDTTRIVPKLSFVKGFEPWQWIVGTGIYLKDVEKEIASLKRRLFVLSSVISIIIILTLLFVIRQSLGIEKKRKLAENNLLWSRQKYKSLVEASTEGTLMMINEKVIFSNLCFTQMMGCPSANITGKTFDELFEIGWADVYKKFADPNKSVNLETRMICQNKSAKEVIISLSRIDYSGQEAIIVVAKLIGRQKQMERGAQHLTQELQSSLHLMNQPIATFIKEPVSCTIETSIQDACSRMIDTGQKAIFVMAQQQIIGVVNEADFSKRVVAAGLNPAYSMSKIMSAPVVSISKDALLFEAMLQFRKHNISHLLVKDASETILGCISNQECLEMQRNSVSYLIREIDMSRHADELKKIYSRIPLIIKAFLAGGDSIRNVNRIITSVADVFSKRVIRLAIEETGNPPCAFAFFCLGSEGRSEQTLKTDQDNAIVYNDDTDGAELYFRRLAYLINKNLDTIGYNRCEGNFMASNEKWCRPIKDWEVYFLQWTKEPNPQNVLDSSIFFDLRFVFGEESLVNRLKDHIKHETSQNTLFFYHLASASINYKPTIEEGKLNLKKALVPIVGYARVLALRHGVNETNTLLRLQELAKRAIISKGRMDEISKMYTTLMQYRLELHMNQILSVENPENVLDLATLSNLEQSTLKNILHEISVLQTALKIEFRTGE